MRNTSGNIASLSITLFLAAGTFPAPSRHPPGRSDHSLRTRFDPPLSRTPDRQATNRSGGRPHEFQDQEPCSPLALRPLLRLPWNSAQNSPGDEEAGEEDEGQEGGKPPFGPNRPPSEPPFPPPEEPRHTASSLPMPERLLSPSGSLPPPRILRNARPNPSPPQPLPNRLRIIRRIRARPLLLFFTRRPPSASSNRRQSCSFPGPTTTLKGSPSSFAQTRAFVPFRFLCPSIPTPSPLFSPPPAWNQPPPPPPSPSPAYTPSPEGLAGSGARPPSPGVPETAARRSDRRHMGEAYRTTGNL